MGAWTRTLIVAVGGALGANARYWLGHWINTWADPRWPWATFAINVSGSFLAGVIASLLARWWPQPHWRLLVLVGFVGGYTTFSTFALEAFDLAGRGRGGAALTYALGSTVAGVVAVALGMAVARRLA